jgi:hypothetical protein
MFAFGIQDSIKELVRTMVMHGQTIQAEAIVQSAQIMELCAVIDTFVGMLLALFAGMTTVFYIISHWENLKQGFRRIRCWIQTRKNQWKQSTRQNSS